MNEFAGLLAPGEGPTAAETSAAVDRARPCILMVDDQPAKLLTYEAILSGLDVTCVRAHSGEEGLAKLLQQEFAVILLDVNMPGMDGFEVARLIRAHPRLDKTPIIFVTALHGGDVDRLRGYEVGAIDYISVPVVPDVLRSKVAVLAELHRRRAQLEGVNRALAKAREQLVLEHARALAARDERLRAVFNHPDQMAVVLRAERDGSGRVRDLVYVDANVNAERMLGMNKQQLTGRRLTEVLPDRAADRISLGETVLATGEPARYDTRMRDVDMGTTMYPIGNDELVVAAFDITARKRAESSLRQSEERYRALLEHAPVAVVHAATDGRIEYANQSFCELLGYSPAELRDKTWQDITHPEDLKSDEDLAKQVLKHELPHYTLHKRYIRKDGSPVWVELFGSFLFDPHGRPLQGLAVAIDITSRREYERAIRESQESLVLAKTAARLGTFDWDIPNDSLVWDERTHELWGIPPAGPMKVASFFSQVHPDDHASAQRAIDKAFDPNGDRRFSALYRVINRIDGIIRWIEATGRVYFDGEAPARLVGVVQEVTERIEAQQRLHESEQRLRELANNIDQFAWTCDASGRATWYNDRWYQYTGMSPEAMEGETWQAALHPEHVSRVMERFHRCLQAGVPYEDTFPLRNWDGEYRWFLTRAVPIRDSDGGVLRWFGTNTDVTEQRNLQEALEETDRRKDHFLAMLAHELRNPVAPITSSAEALARTLKDEGSRRLAAIVRRQAQNLSRLLDDLLDVARITQGRIHLQSEVVAVETCIALALETAEPLIQDRRHQLTIGQSAESLYVTADKVRLAQCLDNLLTNAAKYTEPGGEIRIRPYRDGDVAVIEVSDNGQGISPEFLPHMFELFAQSERSLDRSQGGLGIGLSVCRQLIEMQGGTVMGRSQGVGKGATFTLRLPLAQRPEPAVSPSGTTPETRRILIVDDNRDAADSLAMLLQIDGHVVETAYSAEQGLERLRDYVPQVALLDIGLPGMNGYELARRVREVGVPGLRLIALTGYGQPEDRARATAAGFDAHLLKPVELDRLKEVLSTRGS